MRYLNPNRSTASPEQLQLKLALLACEREQLRNNGAEHESLEHNRLEIGRSQYELSLALIQRHLIRPAKRAA
jgi:hypothetical protein